MFKISLSTKQLIDHAIGGPLAWSVNVVAQIAGFFLKRDHALTTPPRSILFLKFVGIGSIVRASFLLKSAREKYPNAKILFGVFPGCAGMAKLYPEVDEVFVVRDGSPFTLIKDTIGLVVFAWKNKVDLVVDLEVHAKYSSIVSALTCATNRAGFAGTSSRFRRGLYTHLVFWNPIRFVDHAYAQLGASIGLMKPAEPTMPIIPDNAEKKLQEYCASKHITPSTILIGINPNASDLKTERRWPLEYFAELINHLPGEHNIVVAILGAPSEREYTEELLRACSNAKVTVYNTAGELPFASFVALLRRLNALVTNDTGPLHIASCFSIPTVSLWGPTHPINYSPRASRSISLYKPIYCSPCTHSSDVPPCGGDNQCMKIISWVRVYKALCRLIALPLPADLPTEINLQKNLEQSSYLIGYWRRSSATPPVPELEAKKQ